VPAGRWDSTGARNAARCRRTPTGTGWSPDQIDLDAGARDGEPASRAEVHPSLKWDLLHRGGWTVGNRLMKRLWRMERLLVPPNNGKQRRKRRRIGTGENGIVRRRATRRNQVWGMDFVQDRTADGRPFRMLVVLNEYTRECLAIEVHRNLRGEHIVAVLDELTAIRGAPPHQPDRT